MNQKEKLEKVCNDFSKLNEEQQDYILGILQALAFAKSTHDKPKPEKASSDSKR
jgi:hypothetical protein